MSKKELNTYLRKMEAYKKRVLSSEKLSNEYLIKAGILTKKGNITKKYKGVLCIQPSQD
jgi:hypothetical protein